MAHKICQICAIPLTSAETAGGNICSRVQCKTAALGARTIGSMQQREAKATRLQHNIQERYQQYLKENNVNEASMPLYTLPAVDSELETVSLANRRRFLRFLIKMLRYTVAGLYDAAKDRREQLFLTTELRPGPISGQENNLLGQLCATCKGYCCQQGESYAYITPSMLKAKLESDNFTLQSLFRTYKSYLPKSSIKASCVYHTATGCTLPLSLRSNTCNQFLCKASAEIICDYREKPFKQAYIVAHHPDYIVRSNKLEM
ncbi:MAG: hypothetical protein R3240_07090 [Gammaproteobacteria bacterium]|nr:hypothetical protein [Gammaproteobacteria bacterium]